MLGREEKAFLKSHNIDDYLRVLNKHGLFEDLSDTFLVNTK